MDLKEYLLEQSEINLGYIAEKMWPTNKSAKGYLSMKLNDNAGRTWTAKDNELCKSVLKELGEKLVKLSQ